ncbi:CheA signal transduction histidine kinase [Anaeromyxobacter sp. K]|uniref:chemotaxis protein CheA n=1 Tax=Anaeromyxobacter sp. (strain K) TaxID=447217 RepID=UPI00015F8552|nr:chemotaxis protein CheA [Anaeromyxobacter sp. K]ACG74052.1 CheA signal transduction histidine kinase [Anaeromyxobacter sp. K]
MPADRSQKALAEFVSEAQETIDALGHGLMQLEAGGHEDPDPDVLNGVFRAAHTLKGLSSMSGVERLTRLAHALEDLLDEVRLGRRRLDRPALDLLLEAPEVLSRIVAEEATGAAPASTDAAARLTDRLRAGEAPPPARAADSLATVALGPEVRGILTEYEEHRLRANLDKGLGLHRVKVSFDLDGFDRELAALSGRLKRLGEVVSTLPSSDLRDPQAIAFELLFASKEPVDAIRREAGPAAAVEAVPRVEAPPPAPRADAPRRAGGALSPAPEAPSEDAASLRSASQAVRVDIHELDRLMNAVGELVLVKTSLVALAERLRAEGRDPAAAAELQRINRTLERRLEELQAGILEVRMVPLEQVFDKLSRMVRKLAREVGKEIDLRVSGGEVELDKLIVEDLSDPLMHLIRNAIDHGIEAPERRARAGKPPLGTVRLEAAPQGNKVRIVVEDDGGGIDEDRIREVAVQRGLATAGDVGALSRRELMNLIFVPGFSTARQVTSLSGRGVGMDVVKSNVAALSGIIDLHTERGRGTRFEITLPVTLAIVRALVVWVAGRTYAVPLNSVLEILEVRAAEVRTLSTREVVTVRGATLPLVRLSTFFGLPGAGAPERLFVVVVGLAQERLGVAVDAVVGQQDVVVKPLGSVLQGVRGIAGATDLGSRRTVLVLDVGAIIEDVVSGEPREAAG